MAFEEMEEYSWLQSLPSDQQKLVEYVDMTFAPVLNVNLLPHLTDHSIHHSRRVVEHLGRLLSTNLSGPDELRLSPQETTILVLATLLHDISLQIPKAFGISCDPKDIKSQDIERMRRDHGEVSGIILRDIANGKNDYNLDGLTDERTRKILPLVAFICEHHQSSKKYDPDETAPLGSRKIRIGVLTALLRLADEIAGNAG